MAKPDTRKKILKAAEDLFSKNGYDGVRTKKIASEAGITEMTLFNHFSNKELLYKTVVKERYLAIGIESVLPELTYENLESDLMTISSMLLENFVCNRKVLMMRLKEKESFHNDDTFKMAKDPLLTQITPLFNSYEEKGILRGPGEKAALLFMASFKGLCHICLLEDLKEEEIKTLSTSFVHTFCHGTIFNPPSLTTNSAL